MSQSRIQRMSPRAELRALWDEIRPKCWWRTVTVLTVTCALAFAVATRYTNYSHLTTHSTSSITQSDEGTKRQHIDKSSFTWTFARASCVGLVVPPTRPRVVNFTSPLVKLSYRADLYNRPPPPASLML
jgi:hypothetical protein